jgi:hypothetical protein
MPKLDNNRTGAHVPVRGKLSFPAEENPRYAPGNHYSLERVEGTGSDTVVVTYHKATCYANDTAGGEPEGVFFDLSLPVFATWCYLA